MKRVGKRFSPLRAIGAIAIAAALYVSMASGILAQPAPDSFDPAVVDVTLAPGDSATIDKTLHLDALPGAADIIIAIDTTGSMFGAIDDAQTQATALCNDVQAAIPGARFAVVDFKDYPTSPYGGFGDSPYTLLTAGYVADCATVQAAVNTMVASGGGDFPESYNRVFYEAYSDALLVKDPAAEQFLVVLGDAPPHDPTQTVAPSCGNRAPVDPGPDGIAGTADDLETEDTIAGLVANNITLLMIRYNAGIPLACYSELAGATGGTAVDSGGDLSDEIISQIRASSAEIDVVDLEWTCSPDGFISISFDPTFPQGPFTAPVDIVFQETIEVAEDTPEGDYVCTVVAVADGVERARQLITVTVPLVSTEGCKVTYGGRIKAANGDKATFGGVAQAPAQGEQEYRDHGPASPLNVHSITTDVVFCSKDGKVAIILGTATIDGAGVYSYRITLNDNGEPGKTDTYRIQLSNGYDSGTQTLDVGNIQIHLKAS